MKFKFLVLFCALFSIAMYASDGVSNLQVNVANSDNFVRKYTLENGMNVLILPNQHSSEVALFLWLNVGSKHEGIGERGMAHFIEHMIFKGTHTMMSESDINVFASKLSSYVNAFTWYDYTAYVFKLPVQNWEKTLPVFADWMQNCRFLQEHMDSEVKAVIQELDMRRDRHSLSLAEAMASVIFDAHPYHYSVIGFKQDLTRLKQDTLVNFYKKQYIPQNATLVIVGNIEPDQAFEKVSDHFAQIASGQKRPESNFYFNEDVQTQSVTLYRDVKQSIGCVGFVTPGLSEVSDFQLQVLGNLLANDMSSRLYQRLIEQSGLVTSINADDLGIFEKNIFYLMYAPNNVEDIPAIKEIILQEIQDIIANGFTPEEFNRAVKLVQMSYRQSFENIYNVAKFIGKNYLATGDDQALFADLSDHLYDDVMKLLKRYFRRAACHEGYVFNVADQDKGFFQDRMQEARDMSSAMVAQKVRESQVEPVRYADTVSADKITKKEFPKPEVITLSNGLEVLLYQSNSVDLVKCVLSYKADALYDTPGQEGIGAMVASMMLEGTKDLPGLQFAQTVGSYGISISASAGSLDICMLPEDVARGLGYFRSVLTDANFDQSSFDKIKTEQFMSIKQAEDNAGFILKRAVHQIMYQGHVCAKPYLVSQDSINAIDRDRCFDFYKKYVSPQGARLAIVGNYDKTTIRQMVKDIFESWQGEVIPDLVCPDVHAVVPSTIDIVMNRDQVHIGFFAPSVTYLDADFEYLVLFTKLLGGSSDSFLFALREQTGLFYSYGASLTYGSSLYPGIVLVNTMVAPDRVEEARENIFRIMIESVDLVTDEKFEQAKEARIYDYFKWYETLSGQANRFLFLKEYGLPFDYFETQIDKIRSMTKEDMQKVVKKYLSKDKLSCIRVGTF